MSGLQSVLSGEGGPSAIRVFDVLRYGAIHDGKTFCTAAVQNAIDACAASGGGIVYFPPGGYLTGTLVLKSNVALDLEAGASLLGSQSLSDYHPDHPNLIYAKDAENLSIEGRGTIDGQGEVFWRGKGYPYQRPGNLIHFEKCRTVRIHGITINNSPNWVVRLTRCDWVFIDGIKIINAMEAPNTDGIDPVSCSNVFISNCYIETGDDAICPKSEDKGKPCENIVVTNCVLISDDSAIKCGTGSKGEIKHCVFSNIVIRNTKYGIGFYMKDGGTFEDIRFSNITIETTQLPRENANRTGIYPIFMDIEPRDKNTGLGTIRDIAFSNITMDTQNGNCLIQGRSDKPIEHLIFENVIMRVLSRTDFSGRRKPRGTRTLTEKAINDYADVPAHFTFAHIRDLNIRNLEVRDESNAERSERHAVWGIRLTDVTLDGLKMEQKTPNTKLSILNLTDCENVLIRSGASFPATVPFLRLEGIKTTRISLIGNDLSQFNTAVETASDVPKAAVFQSENRLH